MNSYIQKNGARILSEILTGSDKRLNGMYVEASASDIPVGARDHAYYDMLEASAKSGYLRVPIQTSYVDDNNTIHFLAIIPWGSLAAKQLPDDCMLRAVTVVCMRDNSPANDEFVYTAKLKDPVAVVQGAETSIHLTLSLMGK